MQEGKLEVSAWFTFSLQSVRNSGEKNAGIFQITPEPILVRLAEVPVSEIESGLPCQGLLWQIEDSFMMEIKSRFTDFNVIWWEARWGARDGVLVSRFRDVLAADAN